MGFILTIIQYPFYYSLFAYAFLFTIIMNNLSSTAVESGSIDGSHKLSTDDTAAANMFDFWQVGITEPNRLAMAQRYTAI